MRKFLLVAAIMFWLAAVILPTLMIASNNQEIRTIDLSAIDTRQIITGVNEFVESQKCSVMDFVSRSYDYVLVGIEDRNCIVYQGQTSIAWNTGWYQAEDELDTGITQEIERIELSNQNKTLTVYFGKDECIVGFFSFFSVFLFGLSGFAFFASKK